VQAQKSSVVIALLLVLIDQISKFLVIKNIGHEDVINITPCLNFILTFNKGVTFGLLKANSSLHLVLLLAGICIMSLVVGIWWIRAENSIQRYATAMILSGAFGNLIDRLRFHGVVDFIDFHIFGYHWYTFNVADSAIVLGVGLLLLDNFLKKDTYTISRI
jgi:signal peptidase II